MDRHGSMSEGTKKRGGKIENRFRNEGWYFRRVERNAITAGWNHVSVNRVYGTSERIGEMIPGKNEEEISLLLPSQNSSQIYSLYLYFRTENCETLFEFASSKSIQPKIIHHFDPPQNQLVQTHLCSRSNNDISIQKFLSFAPPRYALSIAHFIPLESYWLKTKRVVLNRKEETGFASILDPEWTGLSGSGFRFQSSRRLDPQRWRNVDVRGNTRVSRVCIMQWSWSGALDASPSTRRGRKGGGGMGDEGAKRRRWRWNRGTQGTLCLNRHATLVFPLPYHPSSTSPFTVEHRRCVFASLPSSDFPRSRFSLFRSYPFFPSFFLCIVSQWWTPPFDAFHPRLLTPRPGPRIEVPFIFELREIPRAKRVTPSSLSFSPFFLLSLSVLCSPLLSIHLSALLSALAFVDRVILAPGRRQNQGKMGEWREEGRTIFGFLGTGNGNGEGGSKGGVEWRVECSFLFLLPNRDGFYVICPIAIARRREQMCEIEWVKQRRVG